MKKNTNNFVEKTFDKIIDTAINGGNTTIYITVGLVVLFFVAVGCFAAWHFLRS